MTLAEGTQLGPCRIIRLLSSGAVGDVYLGQQSDLGRQVAIKVLRDYGAGETTNDARERTIARFTQEARAIAALEHPNIVPIYQFGEQQGIYYLVMQFIPDGSLATLMTARHPNPLFHPPCTPSVTLAVISPAASALQYAHDRHLMHLDVKPHNLLIKMLGNEVSAGGQELPFHVFLSDFGLAQLMTLQSFQSGMTGTPLYTAPEQYQQHPAPASDQYALACVAYQMLTGSAPFQGGLAELHHQHLQTPAPPITNRNPALPPALNAIFATALAKDPAQRYPSVAQFAQTLASVFVTASAPYTLSMPTEVPRIVLPPQPSSYPATVSATASVSAPPTATPTPSAPPLPMGPSTGALVMDEPTQPLPRRPNPLVGGVRRLPLAASISGAVGLVVILAVLGVLAVRAFSKPTTTVPPLFNVVYQRPIQGAPNARPVINGNVIYEAAHDGTLYALAADTGQEIWHYKTNGTLVAGVTVDSNGIIYLPAGDGTLYALMPDGSLKWKSTLSSALTTTPVLAKNIVCVSTTDGRISGIDMTSGRRLWQLNAQAPFAAEGTVVNDTLYIGNTNHTFYAFDIVKGKKLWGYAASGAIKSGAVVTNNTVVFGTENNSLYGIDATTGKFKWRYTTGGAIEAQPIANGGSIYTAGKDGVLSSVDATAGSLIWPLTLGDPVSNDALLVGSRVIVFADDGVVSVVDPTTPSLLGKFQLGQTISAPAAINGNRIYVSGNGFFEVLTLTGK